MTAGQTFRSSSSLPSLRCSPSRLSTKPSTRRQRATHDRQRREEQQDEDDRNGAGHDGSLARGQRLECPRLDLDRAAGGKRGHADRAARRAVSPKPATYASLKAAKVSMSVRKHSVLATSATVAPIVASWPSGSRTACAVCAATPPSTRRRPHAELAAHDDPVAGAHDRGVRAEWFRHGRSVGSRRADPHADVASVARDDSPKSRRVVVPCRSCCRQAGVTVVRHCSPPAVTTRPRSSVATLRQATDDTSGGVGAPEPSQSCSASRTSAVHARRCRLPVSLADTAGNSSTARAARPVGSKTSMAIASSTSSPTARHGMSVPYWEVRATLPEALVYTMRLEGDDRLRRTFSCST